MSADPLWITERDVVELIALPAAIEAVEGGFRAEAAGSITLMEKTHAGWGDGHTLHAIGAVDVHAQLAATKTWAHTAGGATPVVLLWSAADGGLLAVLEAFALGQLRTGAVAGVATRWLAEPEASTLAVIGTGRQAAAQVAAVTAVRDIGELRVHSPTPGNRVAFAERLERLDRGVRIVLCDTVERAVADADVVTTVTRARRPILTAAMLAPRVHINAVGAITPERRELDHDVLVRAGLVVADSVDAARRLAAELQDVNEIVRLADVVGHRGIPQPSHGLTVFKAMGVGLADLAVAAEVLRRAEERGRGRPLSRPRAATPAFKEMMT